jgi:hypothetical protein
MRSVVAESVLVKQQLLILNRSRQRSPNLLTNMLVCQAWENMMLARCRPKLKKTFADDSLRQCNRVFRKPRRLGFSG